MALTKRTGPLEWLRALRGPLVALAALLVVASALRPSLAIAEPTLLCVSVPDERGEAPLPECPVLAALVASLDLGDVGAGVAEAERREVALADRAASVPAPTCPDISGAHRPRGPPA